MQAALASQPSGIAVWCHCDWSPPAEFVEKRYDAISHRVKHVELSLILHVFRRAFILRGSPYRQLLHDISKNNPSRQYHRNSMPKMKIMLKTTVSLLFLLPALAAAMVAEPHGSDKLIARGCASDNCVRGESINEAICLSSLGKSVPKGSLHD